jgi:hypothetical protein
MQMSDEEKLSSTALATVLEKRNFTAALAYATITGKLLEYYNFTGHGFVYEKNWMRLLKTILPTFFIMATLQPTARFEAIQELTRDRPRATRPGERVERPVNDWDFATPRNAVAALVDQINDLAEHGRQLFATALGRPGSVSRSVDLQNGDFVARVEGVYFPLVLRRVASAPDEFKIIGHAIVAEMRESIETYGPLDEINLV